MSAQTLACAMRRETAFLLPPRAFLCLSGGHGPTTSRKSRPAKPIDFTRQPRRSAGKARTGRASTLSAEHLLHPSFRLGRGFGPRLPSTSSLCALALHRTWRTHEPPRSSRLAGRSTSWDFCVVVPCCPSRVSHWSSRDRPWAAHVTSELDRLSELPAADQPSWRLPGRHAPGMLDFVQCRPRDHFAPRTLPPRPECLVVGIEQDVNRSSNGP